MKLNESIKWKQTLCHIVNVTYLVLWHDKWSNVRIGNSEVGNLSFMSNDATIIA